MCAEMGNDLGGKNGKILVRVSESRLISAYTLTWICR
jgi:hypothetical protein